MGIIDNIINSLVDTRITLDLVVDDSVRVAVDENKRQMRLGLDSRNNTLSSYAMDWYAKYKNSLSSYQAPTGVPDLYLSGAFQKSMFGLISADRNSITISSTDSKTGKLTKQYGQQIFGLGMTAGKNYTSFIYRQMLQEMKTIWT